MSLTTRVLIALIAGVALGMMVSASGNPALIGLAGRIEPVGTLFINAIRMTVIPLVVGSLIAGLASTPNPAALGKSGARAVAIFMVTLFAGGAFAALVAPPVLARIPIDSQASADLRATAVSSADATRSSVEQLPGFADWLVSLVPSNPIKSAADGAMLPLIVFALLFGLAIAGQKGESRGAVVSVFEAVRDAALTLVQWVLWTAPLGVFALALSLAARLGASAAGALAGYVALVAAMTVVFGAAVLYPMAVLLGRIPLRDFARAVLPAQAVAFSSRSSLAALPAMIQAAKERLQLPPEVPGFFLPLAASVYRIGAAVGQTTGVLFIARLYGIDLDPATLATVVLTVVATSFSVPGIPGGSIVIMAPVLQAAGLPVEGIGILLGVDTIPDMFRTTINVTGHMAAAVAVSPRSDTSGSRAPFEFPDQGVG